MFDIHKMVNEEMRLEEKAKGEVLLMHVVGVTPDLANLSSLNDACRY